MYTPRTTCRFAQDIAFEDSEVDLVACRQKYQPEMGLMLP
jgi:hypothetical protein